MELSCVLCSAAQVLLEKPLPPFHSMFILTEFPASATAAGQDSPAPSVPGLSEQVLALSEIPSPSLSPCPVPPCPASPSFSRDTWEILAGVSGVSTLCCPLWISQEAHQGVSALGCPLQPCPAPAFPRIPGRSWLARWGHRQCHLALVLVATQSSHRITRGWPCPCTFLFPLHLPGAFLSFPCWCKHGHFHHLSEQPNLYFLCGI